jgi:hypothetical protein
MTNAEQRVRRSPSSPRPPLAWPAALPSVGGGCSGLWLITSRPLAEGDAATLAKPGQRLLRPLAEGAAAPATLHHALSPAPAWEGERSPDTLNPPVLTPSCHGRA